MRDHVHMLVMIPPSLSVSAFMGYLKGKSALMMFDSIPFKAIHITDKESAQNVPAPVTTYALFRDGQFLTQSIQSDKKFLALAGL